MSNAASHASTFYRQVAAEGKVWTICDAGGIPSPINSEGNRSMPFWSSLSRVQEIIANVPAYSGFEPKEISLEGFRDRWLPGLKRDGLLVGVNWSGPKAKGYDLQPDTVLEAIEFQLSQAGE